MRVSLILLPLVFFLNLWLYLSHQFPMETFFNSDAAYLPVLYKDIVTGTGSFSDWFIPSAPYFFPDGLLYFLANLFTGDWYFAVPLFFTLEHIMLVCALFMFYRSCYRRDIAFYALVCAFVAMFTVKSQVYMLQFVSVFHFGEFLSAVVIVSLIVVQLKNERKGLCLLIFIVSFLTSMSDRLFLVHCVAPLIIMLFMAMFLMMPRLDSLILSVKITVTSAVAGFVAWYLFFSSAVSNQVKFNQEMYEANLKAVGRILYHSVDSFPLAVAVMVITFGGAFILYAYLVLAAQCRVKPVLCSCEVYGVMFLLTAALSTLSVIPFVALLLTSRYLIPVFLLPFCFLPLVVLAMTKVFVPQYLKVISRLLILFSLLLVIRHCTNVNPSAVYCDQYYPDDVRAVDSFIGKTGSKTGVCHYWQCKRLSLLTKEDVRFAQVYSSLEYDRTVISSQWKRDRYDFALIDWGAESHYRLDGQKLIRINGEPDSRVVYGVIEMLHYKDGLYLSAAHNGGFSCSWTGAELFSLPDVKSGRAAVAVEGTSVKSCFVYGPWVKLLSGKYMLSLKYSSSSYKDSLAGSVKLTTFPAGDFKPFKTFGLPSTRGAIKEVTVEFEYPEAMNNKKIDIQIFYNGFGRLTVYGLSLTSICQ